MLLLLLLEADESHLEPRRPLVDDLDVGQPHVGDEDEDERDVGEGYDGEGEQQEVVVAGELLYLAEFVFKEDN